MKHLMRVFLGLCLVFFGCVFFGAVWQIMEYNPISFASVFSCLVCNCCFGLCLSAIWEECIMYFYGLYKDYKNNKAEELKKILGALHCHPDKGPEEVVANAVAGARYWKYSTIFNMWRQLETNFCFRVYR